MEDLRVLFIAGNWTDEGGRSSFYMDKLINSFETKLGHPIVSYNGGSLSDLKSILEEHINNSNVVFWAPNIPFDGGMAINPKDFNYKVVLITFKRNDHRYTFEEMISKALASRSDLTCEVKKNEAGRYEMRIFDILGTLWSDFTTNTSSSVEVLVNRSKALLDFNYYKLTNVKNAISPANENLKEIFDTYNQFGHLLMELQFESENNRIRRHLGEISFRGLPEPGNQRTELIYANSRNYRMTADLDPDNFVATKMLNGKVNYYGKKKPHLETGVFDKLMLRLPEINYIFHCHCYVRDARFTERAVPNGCLQEYAEISNVIDSLGMETDFCINLLGHGSLILGSSLDYVKSQFPKLVKRETPEPIGVSFDLIEVNDGVNSFINILNGKTIEEGETLEVQFNDGSIGTHKVNIKEYTDPKGRVHRDASICLIAKGIELEVPLTGLFARRI